MTERRNGRPYRSRERPLIILPFRLETGGRRACWKPSEVDGGEWRDATSWAGMQWHPRRLLANVRECREMQNPLSRDSAISVLPPPFPAGLDSLWSHLECKIVFRQAIKLSVTNYLSSRRLRLAYTCAICCALVKAELNKWISQHE